MLTEWMPSARLVLGKSVVFACFFAMLGVPTVWAAAPQARSQPETAGRLAQTESASIRVIGIKLNPTATQLEIVLETQDGKLLSVDASKFKTEGNSLIADIPAVLAIPNTQTFTAAAPTEDIASIRITQLDPTNIRISITGNTAPPTTVVTLKTGAQTYSLNPKSPEPELEILVTGTRKNEYRVPNSSIGTKTDTPLREIPQSIQIVPQKVLRDRQITRLDDALKNVPGVTAEFNAGPAVYYKIRGFGVSDNSLLRDGLPDPGVGDSVELANVERIEVLKGPASVLFGLGSPGGSINTVTKRPLREPFYGVDAAIGSYSYTRGAIDFSGPLNDSKTALYRFNAAYRNSGSFTDFSNSDSLSVSPVVSVAISDKTKLDVGVDYIKTRDSGKEFGVPVIGSIFANPNGKIPRNRNLTEPSDRVDGTTLRAGYELAHKFNDNWSLNNAFRYGYRSYESTETRPEILGVDNRTVNRSFSTYDNKFTSLALTTNVVGKFSTGSLLHELLFGVDLNRSIGAVPRLTSSDATSIDIFNPVYSRANGPITFEARNEATTDSFGIYLQDRVALTENLKVLVGARFDSFNQNSKDLIANTDSSQSRSAVSPRIGVVYQPIPTVSLYASQINSFTPARGTFLFGANLDTLFEPERGSQFEVGVKADLNNRLSGTLAFYDLTRSNVLVTDPNNQNFQIQTGEQKSKGVELSLTGEISPGWNITTGYAYTDARISQDTALPIGSRLESVPDHTFNAWTTYELQQGDLKGLGFGLGLLFVGSRAGSLPNTYDIPSYLRTDAAIFYKRDQFKAALNFKNLFNTEYAEIGYFGGRIGYGQPFTVQANLGWEF